MQASGSQAIFKRKTPQENCFPVKLPVCFGFFFLTCNTIVEIF